MQRQLLPATMPPHASISFGSYYQTSRHAGGDYYDVLPLGGDRFGILVADVSGHGAPAAIVMAMIRAVVHTYPGVADDPPEVLHYINRHFQFLWDTPMYATAVYAVVDAARATIRMASAGHPLPLKAHCGDGVTPASVDTTMCLLWNELTDVPSVEFPLTRGDRWVFFTDGITDRQAPDGTMFDMERLVASLTKYCAKTPAAIVDGIVGDLQAFSNGMEPEDDQTLLVVGFD
jgi:sigma-B regulation protein RsbU (phosphoserine phosphatase)